MNMKNAEESDLELDIVFVDDVEDNDDEFVEELQRTEAWKEQRRGRWTASQMKNLMGCNQKGSRLPWNEKAKLYRFSEGALKYMYENAMERKTGRYIDSGDGTKQMRYGTRVEPLILKAADEQLAAMGNLESVGFRQFPMMPEAGVSSDSVLRENIPEKLFPVIATVEAKACTTWQTHFNRTFELMDDKSLDFWQTQAQMKAWEVDLCYYIVSEPPTSIEKYLYYDGDIMDLYEDFCKECPISIQEVKASPMHQEALIERIKIGEETIKKWLASVDRNLREIMHEVIDEFKEIDDEAWIDVAEPETLNFDMKKKKKKKKDKKRKR